MDDSSQYKKFQKDLMLKKGTTGRKLYSNKKVTDFEILEWKKIKEIKNYKGINISKTGYEIDD